jgi:hypothetical protein
MRKPTTGTVVHMQLRTSRGDRLDHAFLPDVQLGTATGQQPGPTPAEQTNTVETELNRSKPTNPEQGRRHPRQIPPAQDRERDMRQVAPIRPGLKAWCVAT